MRFLNTRRRIAHNNHLFNGQYIDPKALFVACFDILPSVSCITQVDVNPAYEWIRKQVEGEVIDCYQHSQYNREIGRTEFNVTYILLFGKRLIEVGSDYVSIFHDRANAAWAQQMLDDLAPLTIAETSERRIGFATRQAVSN
jgi:hypothetical protein